MSENDEDFKRRLEEMTKKLEESEKKAQENAKKAQELENQLATEKAKQTRAVYLKVSEKGGASLYGIRRFPVTFYVEEWNRILDMEPEIRAFLKAHEGELTTKS